MILFLAMLGGLHRFAVMSHRLTAKQRDAILKACQNGYYDIPRKISLAELAKDTGISPSTFAEHLRKAKQKLMKHLLLIRNIS